MPKQNTQDLHGDSHTVRDTTIQKDPGEARRVLQDSSFFRVSSRASSSTYWENC